MKTSLFEFDLPSERIAAAPVVPRDASRMLVVDGNSFTDSHIINLPDFLNEGDVMVFNNTMVIPARLQGKRGQASIEVTLHKNISGQLWRAFARPAKRLRLHDTIIFADDFSAVVKTKLESGEVDLEFECNTDFYACLEQYGTMPLPPYMKREAKTTDNTSYQTIYASNKGAVAAPTAGLHFTEGLFSLLKNKKIIHKYVTLHVGAGTFLPVKTDDTDDHKMHSEYAELSLEDANIINDAKRNGKRIIAVGTTSLRVLESAADGNGRLNRFSGETDIFITPGYKFKVVDVLVTNFHLPRSTLFMLVSAFSGVANMQAAYKHAIAQSYRFYSYGDACLLFADKNFP